MGNDLTFGQNILLMFLFVIAMGLLLFLMVGTFTFWDKWKEK